MSEDVTSRGLSYWHETVPGPLTPEPWLCGNVRAAVAIVGAGFTGLWTAHALARAGRSRPTASRGRSSAPKG